MKRKSQTVGWNDLDFTDMNIPQPPPMPVHTINYQDESHLNLLSIFHYVLGGFYFLGIGFLILHFLIMSMVFKMAPIHSSGPSVSPIATVENADPEMQIGTPAPAPAPLSAPEFPAELMTFMSLFYIVLGVLALAMAVTNVLSGNFIKKRKHKTFSYVISGINFLQIPFGTVLGVFTIVVLGRPSVQSAYDSNLRI